MDVLELIEALDDLVYKARRVPFTNEVRLDRDAVYAVLDEMREMIPGEIEQARWMVKALMKTREEMLDEARREAERVLRTARLEAVRTVSEADLGRAAERHGDEMLAEAREQARKLELDEDAWAGVVLSQVELNMNRLFTQSLAAVRSARARLEDADAPPHRVASQQRLSRAAREQRSGGSASGHAESETETSQS